MLPLLLFFLSSPNSPTEILQRGLAALQRGELAQARASFDEVTKKDPRNPYAWASLAETYARLKEPKSADAAAQKAEQFGGQIPAIDHALAIYYSKRGEFARAAAMEQKFAVSDKADPAALERTAALYLNAGLLPEAAATAEKARQEHPSAGADNVLGRALIAQGKAVEGESYLHAAWLADKNDANFSFDYSQVLLRQQDFDRAAEVLAAALQAHPDDVQLILAQGVARYGQRRFEDAISAFLRVIRIDPQVERPYLFLGRMLDQAGSHLAEITSVYEQWSARNPRNAAGLLLLAKARLASDSKDQTVEALLRKSIALDGANWEAHYELGVLLEGKRDWTAAAMELQRSAELDAAQAMPHYHLARVYDRLGEGEKAKAERELHAKLTSPAN